MEIKGVIFDLDGVIVSTDEYHYLAWKKIADSLGIHFDREINEALRGVGRMESLEIILGHSENVYTQKEKETLAEEKNKYYRTLLKHITPCDVLSGVESVLKQLEERNIMTAVGSSSKNAALILARIGMTDRFNAVVDGSEIKKGKPDPEVFLKASYKLGLGPECCLVIEDARAGIDAALAAGMKTVGVGFASGYEKADICVKDLSYLTVDEISANIK